MELEAAVGRGKKSKYGSMRLSGWGVRTRKTNFRCPQVELSTPLSILNRGLPACGKSCGISRAPPLPARTPKVSSYISNGRDRENNDRGRS